MKISFDCWMSVKALAEMRRNETKESRFMARNMMAGTAMGAEVSASRRVTDDTELGCDASRFSLLLPPARRPTALLDVLFLAGSYVEVAHDHE